MSGAVEKIAPVQGYPPGIPWHMHLRAYEAYCKKWGPQPALINLEGRNCRGGFGTGELDEFIPGWRDEVSGYADLKRDAARWRALLAAGPRMMGTYGLDHHEDGTVTRTPDADYVHAGVELWTGARAAYFAPARTQRGEAILTAIADLMIEQGGQPKIFGGDR